MMQRLTRVVAPLLDPMRLRHRLRPRSRLTFLLERLLVRGVHFRLLVIAALLGLVAGGAGLLVLAVDGEFGGAGEAVWWAFLRLTDPGYLGDDAGLGRRVISTGVTIAGYVLFMGALIAIMTQWLSQTMRSLERGLTPISESDHVLVLGWSNRTPPLVQELVRSEERVARFLRRRGARKLRIVILAEEVDASLVQELADTLGTDWDPRQVIFRSGTPLHIDHLARVDFVHAGAVIVPGSDFGRVGGAEQDARIVKVLLSISRYGGMVEDGALPLVVSEIFDPTKLHVARQAYEGRVEIVLSSHFFSRLVTQAIRHPGMTAVFNEILANGEGAEPYVRSCPQFAGHRFEELFDAFPHGVLLGVVRPSGDSFTPILNPPPGLLASEDDRFVVLADSYDEAAPATVSTPVERHAESVPAAPGAASRRVLVLGWSRRVPALLEELESYPRERFEVDVVSNVEVAERQRLVAHLDLALRRTTCSHIVGDYTSLRQLDQQRPADYDSIVIVASEWMESDEEADARTLLTERLLRECLSDSAPSVPRVLVELMNGENLALLGDVAVDHLVSPRIISHILAQVALRRELRAVYDELFGPGGAEFSFVPAADYGLLGQRVPFREVCHLAHRRGETALGLRRADRSLELNPAADAEHMFDDGDALIVVVTDVEQDGEGSVDIET